MNKKQLNNLKNDDESYLLNYIEDLNENNEENLENSNIKNSPISKKNRYFIPFISKMYWFFYHKPSYFFILIPSIFSSFIVIQTQFFMGKIIDSLTTKEAKQLIPKYAFYTFICAFCNAIFNFITYVSWVRIGTLIHNKVRKMLFKSFLEKDISYYDENNIGSMLTLLNNDASLIQRVFNESKINQIQAIGQILSAFFVGFMIYWKLTIGSFLIILFIALMMRKIRFQGQKHFKAMLKIQGIGTTLFTEDISNQRVVYAYRQNENEIKRYFHVLDAIASHEKLVHMFIGISIEGNWLISHATLAFLISFTGYLIISGKISIGSGLALIRSIFLFGSNIDILVGSYNRELRAQEAALRIWNSIEEIPTINPYKGLQPNKFNGKIEFRNVWFKYPTGNKYVLKNLSFIISKGQIIAFVGHSGSGKSTIIQLLLRYYDINEGEIFLDDKSIKEYSPSFLHRVIGLVPQDSILFNISIKENIMYGLDYATDEDIINSAKIANADNFIRKLSNGYNSLAGEKGQLLSGGQRQRIAIARAILKNPKIFITDEATASLDSISEKKVQKALENVMKERTSLIIAHRLGTIKAAQYIYVFNSGEIIEQGNYEQLLKKEGYFYDLIKLQLEDK